MSSIYDFHLPDLGEGLPDATIVEWFIRQGDPITKDAPLVAMETAKAVVEIPAPVSGTILKLAGEPGQVIDTGQVLVQFSMTTGVSQAPTASHPVVPTATDTPPVVPVDQGSVVGAVKQGDDIQAQVPITVGGVKAMPMVRAQARKLGIDLSQVRATGHDGAVTLDDLKQAAQTRTAKPSQMAEPRAPVSVSPARTPLSANGKPMRTVPPGQARVGQPQAVTGVRREMARAMARTHSQVVPTTVFEDADIHAWHAGHDITCRLVRAIVVACRTEPALNAWFDGDNLTLTRHAHVDMGIAVDTADGLFVPVLRNADMLDARSIREGINRLRQQIEHRSIAASELGGHTFSLSNFGMYAGRYATPVVTPPCVAIVAVGRARFQLVPVMGGIETHRVLPLSLTFDHRACTGGEATRFMRALVDDLALPN